MRPYPPERIVRYGRGSTWKMFIVYVLQDENGKLYKGHTNNLERRFSEHCRGDTKSIKNFVNPKIVYTEKFDSRTEAVSRERYLKTAAGRKFLKTQMRP